MPRGSSVATTSISSPARSPPMRCTVKWRTLCLRPRSSISDGRLADISSTLMIEGSTLEARHPANQAAVDVGERCYAEQRHVARELGLQNRERLRDARFAARAQPVEMRAPPGARARAERERFQDMRAAAHAAVEDDLEAVPGRVDDLLQHVDRRR